MVGALLVGGCVIGYTFLKVLLLFPKQQGGKCYGWGTSCWLLFPKQQGVKCWDWVHFLITGRAAVVMFWKCESGINDKDTGDVTDGKLGKELPGRTLEVGQEGQIS